VSRRCHNRTQSPPRRAQRLVLRVRVDARGRRGVGMGRATWRYGQRDAPKVQRRAARVAGIVQPDGTHIRNLGQLVPHPRERVRRVRLPRLIDRDVAAVSQNAIDPRPVPTSRQRQPG
jgi:hypothetical protein